MLVPNMMGSIVGADRFHRLILSWHPRVHNSLEKNGHHYVLFSVTAFLRGKCSFSLSFKSTFVASLTV